MSTSRRVHRGPLVAACCLLLLILPVLALTIGGDDEASTSLPPGPTEHPGLTPTTVDELAQAEPTLAATVTQEAETAQGGAVEVPVMLSAEERDRVKPNELGQIPVLMYHAFTQNEAHLDEWTLTTDQFQTQLQWLYDHDFYITPLVDLINNEISVPAGKKPVVLTFDDSSSGQFRLFKEDDGSFVPDPLSAVGVMEAFYAAHPDFGRGGLFAVVPTNCFAYDEQETTCEERITWLAEHGYEIANHTWWHENLHTVSDEMFMDQVGGTKIWIDERVKVREANLSNVLILPFGEWPRNDGQVQMLLDGFVYEGQDIRIGGVVEVSGGFSPSPSSGEWSRRSIHRINTDPESWSYWMGQVETDDATMFVSDGNPGTVTVPNQLAADVVDMWDHEWASSYGMVVIRYDLPE